jgi:hypothetical protein
VADAPAVGAECRQAELHVEELAPAAHRLARGERAWELARLAMSAGEEESKEQDAGSRGGGCHGHFQGGFFCSQVLLYACELGMVAS